MIIIYGYHIWRRYMMMTYDDLRFIYGDICFINGEIWFIHNDIRWSALYMIIYDFICFFDSVDRDLDDI